MKIVTIGLSPFLVASRSKQHSLIMRYLYLTGQSVASIVWGHNTDYFVPEDVDNQKQFFYDFDYEGSKHKIPIFPFDRGPKESIQVYEILNQLKPDLVIAIGDIKDFIYLHAVNSFYPESLKWLGVIMHYNDPIHFDHQQVIDIFDGILCTSEFGYQSIKNLYTKDLIDTCYVGVNPQIYYPTDSSDSNTFRIMACPKVSQSDCAPTIIESVSELTNEIKHLQLYIHSNINDPGDHDLISLQEKFDPDETFITFPEKYVSILDGLSEIDMSHEYRSSDMFVSIPMISATSMSVFQAISSGCYPILSNCGSNRNIAQLLSNFLGNDFVKEDFLVPSIKVMAAGDTYLYICGKEELKKKILSAYGKIKKYKGLRNKLLEFTPKYSQGLFLEKVAEMATSVLKSQPVICLEESVKGD